jgi:hypothetical protein
MDLVGASGAGSRGRLAIKSNRRSADDLLMASWLDRIWRKTTLRKGTLRTEVTEAETESIEAALADAEELAIRTSELARDLHRLLARGIARRRAERDTDRTLH